MRNSRMASIRNSVLLLVVAVALVLGFMVVSFFSKRHHQAGEPSTQPSANVQRAAAETQAGDLSPPSQLRRQPTPTTGMGTRLRPSIPPSSNLATDRASGVVATSSHSANPEDRPEPSPIAKATQSATHAADLVVKEDMRDAIHHFQANPNDRMEAAQKLLPLLKPGLRKDHVRQILGTPSQGTYSDASWFYVLFYSQFIQVYFDEEGRVTQVISTVTTQPHVGREP